MKNCGLFLFMEKDWYKIESQICTTYILDELDDFCGHLVFKPLIVPVYGVAHYKVLKHCPTRERRNPRPS